MKRAVAVCLLSAALLPAGELARAQKAHPEEVSTAKLVAFNVALTGSFAVGRRWIEGRLHSWQDALETFLYAGVGGYGFYQAKRLVGDGKPLAGLGLAYLSASVVENAAQGRHPLAYLRLGTGPVDLRIRTPLSAPDRSGPFVTFEVNAISAVLSLIWLRGVYRLNFGNGLLFFRDPNAIGQDGTIGTTINRTVLLFKDSGPRAFRHEMIHVIQALQAGAVTPYYRLSSIWPGLPYTLGGVVAWDVQFDWLYMAFGPAMLLVDYPNRWPEIEAYTLDHPERESPDWCNAPSDGACAARF